MYNVVLSKGFKLLNATDLAQSSRFKPRCTIRGGDGDAA